MASACTVQPVLCKKGVLLNVILNFNITPSILLLYNRCGYKYAHCINNVNRVKTCQLFVLMSHADQWQWLYNKL